MAAPETAAAAAAAELAEAEAEAAEVVGAWAEGRARCLVLGGAQMRALLPQISTDGGLRDWCAGVLADLPTDLPA